MDAEQKRFLLDVLKQASQAVKKEDIAALRQLSDTVLRSVGASEEPLLLTLAVLLYSYAKLFERYQLQKYKDWTKFCSSCFVQFDFAFKFLQQGKFHLVEKQLHDAVAQLRRVEPELKKHITEVLHKAKVNQAAGLYAKGLSLGRTSYLLGVSSFELMDYLGVQGIAEMKENESLPVLQRLAFARSLFQ